MPITQTINPMSNTPSISDPANFEAKAEAFLVADMVTRATELNTFATQANSTAATINAQAVAMTLNATTDTSTTSNTIGTGQKTFTVSVSKSFVAGMFLVIADTAAPTVNSMVVQVFSYSGTTLVVDVLASGVFGSGTKTVWTISLTTAPTPVGSKNDIINGDFRIAQAGTSFAAPASGAYDLDGWQNFNSGTAVFTAAQVAGSTAGRLARQVTITTADTAVATGDFVLDSTKIEGSNIEKYVGNTFTVSFRAKVPVTGIHCMALRNSGNDRSYIKEINFPTANTWQDCSFTVTGGLPTAGTWNYTNGVGLAISFAHMCGTTFQTTPDAWQAGNFLGTANQVNDCATVSNVWALEKVTLNLGAVATTSDISYEQELVRCQRYYETSGIVFLASVATFPTTRWAVTKRAAPTLTILVNGGVGGTVINTTQDPTGAFYQNANNSIDTNGRVAGASRF